jgi:hypothetical protein
MMVAVAIVAGTLAFGLGFVVRYRSCHLCHNREQTETMTVWSVPVSTRRKVETAFPTLVGHRHNWIQYGRSTEGPLWGHSAAGRTDVYADGSTAPDGLR